MEIVKLLGALLATLGVLLVLYLVVALLCKKINKNIKKEAILKCIKNKDENCSSCNGNCEKFAEGLLSGEKTLEDCPKISLSTKNEIKELLEIKPVVTGSKVAFVFCKGGARAKDQYKYLGVNNCNYSNKLFDGRKVCDKGCQGCMDCAKVCPMGAIYKNKNGVAEVNRSLCVGCGECVKKCPDGIIKLIDINQEVVTACRQCDKQGETSGVHEYCTVGCTKCGECVKVCPTGAVYLENDILKFDDSKCIKCHNCVYACPNSTISRIVSDFEKK